MRCACSKLIDGCGSTPGGREKHPETGCYYILCVVHCLLCIFFIVIIIMLSFLIIILCVHVSVDIALSCSQLNLSVSVSLVIVTSVSFSFFSSSWFLFCALSAVHLSCPVNLPPPSPVSLRGRVSHALFSHSIPAFLRFI